MSERVAIELQKAGLLARLDRLVSVHEQLLNQTLLVRGQAIEIQFMLDTLFSVTGNGTGRPVEENAVTDTGLED
mgnify:CR=1 FL=1